MYTLAQMLLDWGQGTGRSLHVCNQACPLNYWPVCDQRGKKYANSCVLKVAQCLDPEIQQAPCPNTCDRKCPRNIDPVCDQSGKQYSNTCLFDIEKCKRPELEIAPCP